MRLCRRVALCTHSRNLESESGRLKASDIAIVKELSDNLQLSESVCLRYFQSAPSALDLDPMFHSASDLKQRARLFFYYERRQLLLAVDNLVNGRDSTMLPEVMRLRLVDSTTDVFLTPAHAGDTSLPVNLMDGIRAMGEEAREAAASDTMKHVRAIADRQTVYVLLHVV